MKKVLLLPLLLISVSLTAQTHPLDIELDKCMEENPGTTSSTICMSEMIDKWDAELNKYYKLLGGNENKALRDAQVAWIKFRDNEHAYIEAKYDYDGTMYRQMKVAARLDIVRERALQLKSDYEFLEVHQ